MDFVQSLKYCCLAQGVGCDVVTRIIDVLALRIHQSHIPMPEVFLDFLVCIAIRSPAVPEGILTSSVFKLVE
jgi:hypothetical protein